MTQYSFSLPFTSTYGTNELAWNRDIIEWHCERCGVEIGDREVAIAHVRTEHGNGTIRPTYSSKGKELIVTAWSLLYGPEATRIMLELITLDSERKMLESMGARPEWVYGEGVTEKLEKAEKSGWNSPAISVLSVDPKLSGLRLIFDERFSESELCTFCFDLKDVDYDNLPGAAKGDKARELVGFYQRRNQVSYLLEILLHKRPDISLQDIVNRGKSA